MDFVNDIRRPSLLNPSVKDDAWIKALRRWRMLWYMFAAFLFVGVIVIELLSNFGANFIYLFGVIGAIVLMFIFADMVDSRIEVYESEKIWAKLDDKPLVYRPGPAVSEQEEEHNR